MVYDWFLDTNTKNEEDEDYVPGADPDERGAASG